MKLSCLWCNSEFDGRSGRKFCCQECHYRYASKKYNPDQYTKRPDLSELNRRLNPNRMTEDVKEKISLSRLGSGSGNGYTKFEGRHLHRIVAERMIGRKLRSGEVVHHIDGNKRNNSADNLLVLPSQSEHAKLHERERKLWNGGDAL